MWRCTVWKRKWLCGMQNPWKFCCLCLLPLLYVDSHVDEHTLWSLWYIIILTYVHNFASLFVVVSSICGSAFPLERIFWCTWHRGSNLQDMHRGRISLSDECYEGDWGSRGRVWWWGASFWRFLKTSGQNETSEFWAVKSCKWSLNGFKWFFWPISGRNA